MERYVPLQRQFSPITESQDELEKDGLLSFLGYVEPKNWDDLGQEFRCVVLAAAGAGKTEELRHRASELSDQGKPSFFIRIEDIETDFYKAFEIGEETRFQTWLQSTEEAWFFLDSVDEARLDNPRTFEKALRRFAQAIKQGAHRAHIYLSSRPYAWRPSEDRSLLDEILFFPKPKDNPENGKQQSDHESALIILNMLPLDNERIRRFCLARGAHNIDRLLLEIKRNNLWSLAERPFDLEGILGKWAEDKALVGRLELLRHNIDQRLRDNHNSNRAQRQPLNLDQAKEGARRLAAAVLLSGQAGLNVPDASAVKPGIEAESVLADWEPTGVRALLERGIFNDIIYGAVRFRHREVRELLAAEWFDTLLKNGNSRYSIESLFFREQYGEKIIAPRLRPVLSWLILFDNEIRLKALRILPEIAVEGGDPSKLPLPERQKILHEIVHRIVAHQDDRSVRNNSAIAQIANSDLSSDILQLINEYQNNDEAIFFLGILVWQGEIADCLIPLMAIALDSSRGKYARIVSARAVMTCSSIEQKQSLWQQLNEAGVPIRRDLLAEVIVGAEPNPHSVEQLLISLNELQPSEPYKVTNLDHSLHEFVIRLPVDGDQQAIIKFINGLHYYLVMPPFIEQRDCFVSERHAWLLSFATHAVARLVEVRSAAALMATALDIMLMVPVVRYWGHNEVREHKGNLQALVPSWPALNDTLYWASIERARLHKAAKTNEPLTDDLSVSWLDHFWKFDITSFPRLLDYMHTRTLQDDRLIALNAAHRVYVQSDMPVQLLTSLQDTVANDPVLQERLDMLLNPPVSNWMTQHEEELAKSQQEHKLRVEQIRQDRDRWITELRANPRRICNLEHLKPGELTKDQYWLLLDVLGNDRKHSSYNGADWQALIPDFGESVAQAYRKAAINQWRHYTPTLQSEGVNRDNSIPYSLIFAMAGLEIEAAEITDFPCHLSESEVLHALRYITWELNEFPSWFERMHQAFPKLTEEAVRKELLWELENTGSDQPMHYILNKLVYQAPWLHHSITPAIMDWATDNPGRININRHHCLQILVKGGTDPDSLAALASRELAQAKELDNISCWYALLVDCDPDNGIPEFKQWLLGLPEEKAKQAAQIFITALIGGSHARDCGPYVGRFRTAEHLKSLYVLMHLHIQAKEDINRANTGAYTPNLRDDAQNARDRLINLITEIPGKAGYIAIKQMIEEHPDPNYRSWMAKLAHQRAEEDGDLEPWTVEQVYAFAQSQTITPATHRQLYDLAVQLLHDLKNWLERGNDSPWKTWQRADEETEMRTLVASWFNQRSRSQYVTAQEPELANSQRMDIWLQNTSIRSPLPIELKLLDKRWSGPKLCERLRNQLVGDYLREESAGCGVMLLISQKLGLEKRWRVNGRIVDKNGLADALKNYWQGIARQYPGVEAIDVIVIDLTTRDQVSDS